MSSLARLTLNACLFLMCATAVSAQGDMYRLPNKKAGSQRQPPAAVATALTNESILSVVEAELTDEVIIRKMRASQCRFDVSPEAIANLKRVKEGWAEKSGRPYCWEDEEPVRT